MAWLVDVDYMGIILSEVKNNALFPLGLKDTYWTSLLAMFLTEAILGCVTAFAVPALDYVTFYAQLVMKRNNNIYKINQPVDEGTYLRLLKTARSHFAAFSPPFAAVVGPRVRICLLRASAMKCAHGASVARALWCAAGRCCAERREKAYDLAVCVLPLRSLCAPSAAGVASNDFAYPLLQAKSSASSGRRSLRFS